MEQQKETMFSTFIGVVVSVCGNALISVALNLQKRAHNKIQQRQISAAYFTDDPQWTNNNGFLPDDGYSSPRSSMEQQQQFILSQEKRGDTQYLKSKLWWLGISLMILGEVGNFVAYGFAPASTIAPLGTTTLVANVILAPLMLKEVFRKRDLIGVFLAVSGAALVVFNSNSEEIALSPELIVQTMTQLRAILYFVLTGIAICVLTLLSPLYGSSSIMIDLGLVAIYGGYTVLSTKSVASLLSLTFLKMFTYSVSYVLILVLVVTAILQIKYLNKALQRFDSTAVIPTQFVLFTVSAIIGSAVIYHDFDDMTSKQLLSFTLGCAIEFLGVYFITSKRTKTGTTPDLSSIVIDDSAVAIYTDEEEEEEETLDRVSSLPSDQQHPYIPIIRKKDPNNNSVPASSSQNTSSPYTHSWRENHTNNYLTLSESANSSSTTAHAHRRQSSVFRGISMASQLVDRGGDDQQPIQLSLSPSNTNRRNSTTLAQLIDGITSVINLHTPSRHGNNTSASRNPIEISIPPTSPSFQNPENASDRELMPIPTNRSSQ